MHVYTLVWLKLDQIGFLIAALVVHVYVLSDWIRILCSSQSRFFFSRGHEPEIEGRWWWCFSSDITTSKSAIVHLVDVIITYTMYKDVASSRSSYAIFLECWGRVCCCRWRKEVSRKWFYYHKLKWVQHHLSQSGMTCFGQLFDFLTSMYTQTIAVDWVAQSNYGCNLSKLCM